MCTKCTECTIQGYTKAVLTLPNVHFLYNDVYIYTIGLRTRHAVFAIHQLVHMVHTVHTFPANNGVGNRQKIRVALGRLPSLRPPNLADLPSNVF